MKILAIFGREKEYNRNRRILKALEENNEVKVISSNKKGLVKKYFDVIFQFLLLKNKRNFDLIYIGFFGQPIVLTLFPFFFGKFIVFDAFISAYDTMIFDRKRANKYSLVALFFYLMDYFSFRLADTVLFDTDEHIKYSSEIFKLKKSKFKKIFIGANEDLFYKRKKTRKDKKFIVGFHGNFVPLQGVPNIVKVARKLKDHDDIIFEMIGDGITFEESKKEARGLNNIKFLGRRPNNQIPDYIKNWDLGLGIFGDTSKSSRVIPNKLFEILYMDIPFLTKESNAIKELFDDPNIITTENNVDKIANKILYIKKNYNKIKPLFEKLRKKAMLKLDQNLNKIIKNIENEKTN